MIRKNGQLEEVSLKETSGFAADKLTAIKEKYGPDTIIGTCSERRLGNEAII